MGESVYFNGAGVRGIIYRRQENRHVQLGIDKLHRTTDGNDTDVELGHQELSQQTLGLQAAAPLGFHRDPPLPWKHRGCFLERGGL